MVYSGVTEVDWVTALNSAFVISIKLTSLRTHTPWAQTDRENVLKSFNCFPSPFSLPFFYPQDFWAPLLPSFPKFWKSLISVLLDIPHEDTGKSCESFSQELNPGPKSRVQFCSWYRFLFAAFLKTNIDHCLECLSCPSPTRNLVIDYCFLHPCTSTPSLALATWSATR